MNPYFYPNGTPRYLPIIPLPVQQIPDPLPPLPVMPVLPAVAATPTRVVAPMDLPTVPAVAAATPTRVAASMNLPTVQARLPAASPSRSLPSQSLPSSTLPTIPSPRAQRLQQRYIAPDVDPAARGFANVTPDQMANAFRLPDRPTYEMTSIRTSSPQLPIVRGFVNMTPDQQWEHLRQKYGSIEFSPTSPGRVFRVNNLNRALIKAVEKGQVTTVLYLVEQGANNFEDGLRVARQTNQPDLVRYFLEKLDETLI